MTRESEATAAIRMRPARTRRSRVAVVTHRCSGCGGAPVCRRICSKNALYAEPDPENFPFRIMRVDVSRCNGCGLCAAAGKNGMRLNGCPWDAIVLVEAINQ